MSHTKLPVQRDLTLQGLYTVDHTPQERTDLQIKAFGKGLLTQHELVALIIEDVAHGALISTEAIPKEVRKALLSGLQACVSSNENVLYFCGAPITLTDELKSRFAIAAAKEQALLEAQS